MSEPAVAVTRLVKRYRETVAVDDISFALTPGSITGLLGGNGAGKTTTIAMIMGLVVPTSGSRHRARRRHAARALPRAATHELRKPLCRHADRLTVRQNLSVFAQLYGVADQRRAHRNPRRRARSH